MSTNEEKVVQLFAQAVSEIKDARKESLMSQDELSEQIGVDRRKIMALEAGKQDLETLILCCDFYDIELNIK